jgi:membrane protease YdiL (CAAX protease family)
LVFAALHFAPGPALVVFVDLAMVLVDSLIYGVIFARSNNVFVSWAAHFLADIAGVVFLLALIK